MSKLKATKTGKAGKRKGQDTLGRLYVRSLRKARVTRSMDLRMLDRIRHGSSEVSDGALAGSRLVKLSVTT
ncbi:hypothetical protein [Pseudomonas sp. T1.Ur]|uniref:hypothetical protein n=1 Tax=Pseudomonas sp. T1.Ur TaxID=2928704 RepID=UPI00201D96A8|nr:hypothetical protein [Pseudomonas sp. T1.Ur]MCL6704782.1 hypothetical protein [Pseudomonas sp. T1.Ur]